MIKSDAAIVTSNHSGVIIIVSANRMREQEGSQRLRL